MAVQLEYVYLRDEFLSATAHLVNNQALQLLKEEYKEDIQSNRKLSRIKNLPALINLLERYDILNSYNVEPMCYILERFIKESHLRNKLMDYKARIQTVNRLLYNEYNSGNIQSGKNNEKHKTIINILETNNPQKTAFPYEINSTQEEQPQNPNRVPIFGSNKYEMLQQVVLEHVSERIGNSWRDAARLLGLCEREIDEIEYKYPFDLKKQCYMAFENYISQCNNDHWMSSLILVLEKVRRRDLRETLEKLVIHGEE